MKIELKPPYKLFTKTITPQRITYKILGISFSFKYNLLKLFKEETQHSIKLQNNYDLSTIKSTKAMILFLIPPQDKGKISGGLMSIFSLCETSRKINGDTVCIISTYPNSQYTYAHNDYFLNNEDIYRFEQIVDNATNLEKLILHIPEYYVKDFYKNLQKKDIDFLKSIHHLHINILNQNIELMPEPSELSSLYKLSSNITQTIAHNRYATQEICDKYQIPTHLFSVHIDLSLYKAYTFEEKRKIIAISPDNNKHKAKILKKLAKELSDWQIVIIENITFAQYMDLISRAYFTITFGEGMDGYFIQPFYVNSIGFAVYNDTFFPNKQFKDLVNVYNSYDEMYQRIVDDIKYYSNNKKQYEHIIQKSINIITKIYRKSHFEDNLKRFYEKKYDFTSKINQKDTIQ